MLNRLIASELLKVAKLILSNYEYIHDPSHTHRPLGAGWKETEEGWSRGKQVHTQIKDESVKSLFGIGGNESKIPSKGKKFEYMASMLKKGISQKEANDFSDYLMNLDNPKKKKVALGWILKKNFNPNEESEKFDIAFDLIEKQKLDFQKFNGPNEVINQDNKSTKKILSESTKFDPDKEKTFSNKVALDKGVVVYNVEDSKEGQKAVRKAIDSHFGYDKNPWCLAARKDGIIHHNQEEIEQMSEEQKEKLGLYSDDELETAWGFWNKYSKFPKRIAFKDGKLLAFYASDDAPMWWDEHDNSSFKIPVEGVIDDENSECYKTFVKETKKVEKLAESEITEDRETAAGSQYCSEEILEKLADDESLVVRRNVVRNENTSAETLKKLAEDEDKWVREKVAENKNTPVETLAKLAEDESWEVRGGVAENRNTPVEILVKLAGDENEYVRRGVAQSNNTPVKALAKLAKDKSWDVRENVARNNNTPAETLSKLAEDKNYWVRMDVARNKNTSAETLTKLAEDEYVWIREAAKKNLESRKSK